MKKTVLVIFCTWMVFHAMGQCLPSAMDSLAVNQLNFGFRNRLLMVLQEDFEPHGMAPRGSSVHCMGAGSLWVSALDDLDSLYVSGEYYGYGNEAYVGPSRSNGNYDCTGSFGQKWDRVWHLDRSSLDQFLADYQNGQLNLQNYPDFRDWPALGDQGNGERALLAPFVDGNGDGTYTPGPDYPRFPGSTALWWMNNDDGPHDETFGNAMGLDIASTAYALDCAQFPCPIGSLDSTIFIHQTITNVSRTDYHDLHLGIMMDVQIGYFQNDYLGCDTLLQMGFGYNATSLDTPLAYGYGSFPPALGYLILPNADFQKMSAFTQFNSDPISFQGGPNSPLKFRQRSQGLWNNGLPMVNDGSQGYSFGSAFPATKFLFPGDPGFCGGPSVGWSEVSANSLPNDRRGILGLGPVDLPAGKTLQLDYAIIFARDSSNANWGSVCELKGYAADILDFWHNSGLQDTFLLSNEVLAEGNDQGFSLYPNPAQDQVWIQSSIPGWISCRIIDLAGQICLERELFSSEKLLDLSPLAPGFYLVELRNARASQTFKIQIFRP